uniref:Uncharacterized protein n=1 Tax=Siphoviridae sp. ctk4d14 TaxID=2825639 RepID=A0A8S5QK15_9CAUD|nr:MAG TPA: hypothetical protein [Siphoviridae sp. ctk4d14]
MSVPAHPHFLFFHYRWPRGSHHRDRKYGYYYFYVCIVNGKLSTETEAIVHDNITGIFTYTRIGYICVGCGTLTVTNDIGAYSAIVSNLPQTYTGNPYPGAFVAEDNTYNDFYINGSAIVNRKPVSKGHTLRLSCVYMCQ